MSLLLNADGDDGDYGVVLVGSDSDVDCLSSACRNKRCVDFLDGGNPVIEYDLKNYAMAIWGEIQILTLTTSRPLDPDLDTHRQRDRLRYSHPG
ncbi:MAG: hypothetical protein ACTS8P_01475 [Arsenophonus sp. NC-XBC3-MAG3]